MAGKTVQKSCTARNANGVNGTAASTLPDGQRAGQHGDVLGELLGQVWQFRKCPNGTVFDAEQYLTSTGIAFLAGVPVKCFTGLCASSSLQSFDGGEEVTPL